MNVNKLTDEELKKIVETSFDNGWSEAKYCYGPVGNELDLFESFSYTSYKEKCLDKITKQILASVAEGS